MAGETPAMAGEANEMEMDINDKPNKACRTTGEAPFSTINDGGKKFAYLGKKFTRAGRQRI
jgi:hypothetical protein